MRKVQVQQDTIENEEHETDDGEEEAKKPSKPIDKQRLKTLFGKYEKADEKWEEAKKALEAAAQERSNVVEEIYGEAGGGPYGYKGDQLKIVKRGSTFFFRGKRKDSNNIEID